jgi:hypothetical protein
MAAESRHDLELVELTWPALAGRQAGPWSRNLSATSKTGRAIGARQAGGPSLFGLSVRHSNGLMTVPGNRTCAGVRDGAGRCDINASLQWFILRCGRNWCLSCFTAIFRDARTG